MSRAESNKSPWYDAHRERNGSPPRLERHQGLRLARSPLDAPGAILRVTSGEVEFRNHGLQRCQGPAR
jgi:hypothetical protein